MVAAFWIPELTFNGRSTSTIWSMSSSRSNEIM